MNPFLKRFQETVEMFPDREAVVDRDGTRSTSYRQLYEQAARVNRWLKEHAIGRETVVARVHRHPDRRDYGGRGLGGP